MTKTELFDEAAQRRVEYWTLGFGSAAAIATAWLWGWKDGVAIEAGALGSWLNFRWLKQGVHALTADGAAEDGRHHRRRSLLKFLGRYALLLAALFVILIGLPRHAFAFVCGLLAIVPAVLTEAVCELVRSARDPGDAPEERHGGQQ